MRYTVPQPQPATDAVIVASLGEATIGEEMRHVEPLPSRNFVPATVSVPTSHLCIVASLHLPSFRPRSFPRFRRCSPDSKAGWRIDTKQGRRRRRQTKQGRESGPKAAMAPLPDVHLSYGPMLIGVFFNMILYGVFIAQALTYFQRCRKDDAWLRYFVGYLFVLETLNTGFDMAIMYQPLILEYEPDYFPTVFVSEPLFVVLVSTPIQIFFAWRIWTITRVVWAPVVVGALAVVAFAGGIYTATKVALIKQFVHKPELHAPALVWFLASCAADVIITVALVLTLTHRKTGFVATDSVIDKIIRMTIQTGLVTSVFSLLDVIFFMVFPHLAINFIFDLPLSKLYSNALLSTLNAREELGSVTSTSTRGSGSGSGVATTKFEEMELSISMEGDGETWLLSTILAVPPPRFSSSVPYKFQRYPALSSPIPLSHSHRVARMYIHTHLPIAASHVPIPAASHPYHPSPHRIHTTHRTPHTMYIPIQSLHHIARRTALHCMYISSHSAYIHIADYIHLPPLVRSFAICLLLTMDCTDTYPHTHPHTLLPCFLASFCRATCRPVHLVVRPFRVVSSRLAPPRPPALPGRPPAFRPHPPRPLAVLVFGFRRPFRLRNSRFRRVSPESPARRDSEQGGVRRDSFIVPLVDHCQRAMIRSAAQ
ncbi:hypothetical protein B0H12DRAFT_100259 [Mycena haematopus]|nr:hypothetical protein B0H12DRAFT_100259 [Mycena haematopus]